MSQQIEALWTRRLFLKTSFAGILLIGSKLALPNLSSANSLLEGRLRFYNVNTKERIAVTYRNRSGEYNQEALKEINYFLRCPHTNQTCEMDIHLLEQINHIEKQVGK